MTTLPGVSGHPSVHLNVRRAVMSAVFDATSLRSHFVKEPTGADRRAEMSVGTAVPGKYLGQGGSFDIDVSSTLLRVCVWTGGVVEIHSLNDRGETLEIETLKNATEFQAVRAIFDHIARHA